MPDVATAVSTPWPPDGAKPWLVKFSPWNALSKNAAITSRITAIFHHTRTLLTRANHLTPK